jgi:hypothetical protein
MLEIYLSFLSYFAKNVEFLHKLLHKVSPTNYDLTDTNLENTSYRAVIETFAVCGACSLLPRLNGSNFMLAL